MFQIKATDINEFSIIEYGNSVFLYDVSFNRKFLNSDSLQ
jgi:hypothetical protein